MITPRLTSEDPRWHLFPTESLIWPPKLIDYGLLPHDQKK